MSETTQAFGVGHVFTWKGEEYPIKPLGVEHAVLFSAWMEEEAWRKVERYAGKVDPTTLQGRLDAVARLVVSNAFDYGKPLWDEAERSVAGRRYRIYLQLSHTAGVTPELVNEMLDSPSGQVLIAKVQAANEGPGANPNGQAPKDSPPSG